MRLPFLVFFLLGLLFCFVMACPYLHTHPPHDSSARHTLTSPIPPSSVCQTLDRLPFAFIFNPKSIILQDLRIHRRSSSILMFCLLAGDVEVNPGPAPAVSPTLNLATFNIRSAASITHLHNKPEILKNIVHDQKIDILCLTETWLRPDSLPATINSILPPS